MSIVVCKLPKAGLGNQLFPLLKALVFAELNNLPIKIIGYNQIKIGPYLRREKSKRNYKGYFIFQKKFFLEWIDKISLFFFYNYEREIEPQIKKIDNTNGRRQYVFSEMPHWDDYFAGLKEHRDKVISNFWKVLSPAHKEKLNLLNAPIIGVHIRMGDFRKLPDGEKFANFGSTRTPENYFVRIIEAIRKIAKSDLKVTIFTDGYLNEFTTLSKLNNIHFIENNPDIVDLVMLSKSKILVTSATSTFSYWAGFMSNAALVIHPDHIHETIRDYETNKLYFEGVLNIDRPSDLLVRNIKEIFHL